MRPSSGWLYPAAVVLCLAGGLNAQAGLVSWTYNWEPLVPVSGTLASDTGSGHMTLSDEPLGHATGSSDTVATNLKVYSTAPADGTPDGFNNKSITLQLTLTDTPSHTSGTMQFTGTFGGTFSSGGSHVTFTPTGTLTQTITLGLDTYKVTFGSYTPPSAPSSTNLGSIGAQVIVNGGTPRSTPEPATMLLGGLGLSFLGAAGWNQRRRDRALAGQAV